MGFWLCLMSLVQMAASERWDNEAHSSSGSLNSPLFKHAMIVG